MENALDEKQTLIDQLREENQKLFMKEFGKLKHEVLSRSQSDNMNVTLPDQRKLQESQLEIAGLRESAAEYQDTIKKLKDRVGQLQQRLDIEEKRDLNSQQINQHIGVTRMHSETVQNKIESMKLNFELLE